MYYSFSDFSSDFSSFSSISSICGNADATSAKSFSVSYCAIPIGWVIRFLPWITGKYGDTKIFVLVVLEQTPCLHSLILQVSLAKLAVPLIWQVALAKLAVPLIWQVALAKLESLDIQMQSVSYIADYVWNSHDHLDSEKSNLSMCNHKK